MTEDDITRRITAAVRAGIHGRDELHDTTDQLTEALAQAEQALAHMGLGVSASVPSPEGNWSLAFTKVGKHWKIVVSTQDTSTPVVNTSRETRCMAADLLPNLVEKLAEEVRVNTQVVTRALERTQEIVRVLRELAPPETP